MKVGYVRVLRLVCIRCHHTRKYAIKTPFLPTFIPKRKILISAACLQTERTIFFHNSQPGAHPPRKLEHITKICEDYLGHGTVAGVGDVTCSLLLPDSVLLASENILDLSFIFLGFFRSFVHQFKARTNPQRNLKIWCLMWDHVFVMSSKLMDWLALKSNRSEKSIQSLSKDARSVNRWRGCKLGRWKMPPATRPQTLRDSFSRSSRGENLITKNARRPEINYGSEKVSSSQKNDS